MTQIESPEHEDNGKEFCLNFLTTAAPEACSAKRPISMVSGRPPISREKVSTIRVNSYQLSMSGMTAGKAIRHLKGRGGATGAVRGD